MVASILFRSKLLQKNGAHPGRSPLAATGSHGERSIARSRGQIWNISLPMLLPRLVDFGIECVFDVV